MDPQDSASTQALQPIRLARARIEPRMRTFRLLTFIQIQDTRWTYSRLLSHL